MTAQSTAASAFGKNFGSPLPPPPPPPPPIKCVDDTFKMDFLQATVKHNNLGGMGPFSSKCTDPTVNPTGRNDPEELRYDNVGTLSGRKVALVIVAATDPVTGVLSEYNPNQGLCGKGAKSNGIAGKFGRINLGNHQQFGTKYSFVFMDDGTPAELPKFEMTFYDFDHGTLSYGTNSLKGGVPAQVNDPSKIFEKGDPLVSCTGNPGPGQSRATINDRNMNGLDGVKERLYVGGYSKYTIANEGKMCQVRSASDKTAVKVMIPDLDPSSATGGFSPVGDPNWFWLQDEDYYCNTAKAPTNPGWMYTNWPCTEVFKGQHVHPTLGLKSTFESTVRGYGCDNPKDPENLDPIAQARAVTLTFEKKSSFFLIYEIESSECYSYMTGGRNFLFTGIGQSKCP